MKHLFVAIVALLICCTGCSESDNSDSESVSEYFLLRVNDTELSLPTDTMSENGASILSYNHELFFISTVFGHGSDSGSQHFLSIAFDKDGKLLYAGQSSQSDEYGANFGYNNYQNFPSNYFDIDIISIDESTSRIKVKLSGTIFMDGYNLDSEPVNINVDANVIYQNDDAYEYGITVGGVEQFCTADLNDAPWIARFEHTNGVFTSTDPYKIEIQFANDAVLGSYNLDGSQTENYLRFSKFNTTTLEYDYYDITGTLTNDYREFHGATKYSFMGTFSFTAVNPANPSDIIQVTDGKFRSYQIF